MGGLRRPAQIRRSRAYPGFELAADGCGGRIRTDDLRVMSPTSCRCSTPRSNYTPEARTSRAAAAQWVGVADGVAGGFGDGLAGVVTRKLRSFGLV
jgi:hypothetical protein